MIDKGCLKNTIPLSFKEHPNWKMLVYIYLCLPQSLSKKIAYTQYTPWKFNYIIYIIDTKMRLWKNFISFEIWSFLSIQAKLFGAFHSPKTHRQTFPLSMPWPIRWSAPSLLSLQLPPSLLTPQRWADRIRSKQRSTPPKTNGWILKMRWFGKGNSL